MEKYVIEGGNPLTGKIKASGNKNAALPILAATLLTDEEIILKNIPEIEDVQIMMQILEKTGMKIEKIKNNEYRLKLADIKTSTIDRKLGSLIRTSILFAGPLVSRCGQIIVPPPGGDMIGQRRMDTHFLAFKELGAQFEIKPNYFRISAHELVGNDIFLDETSVTGTENIIMASVLAKGTTIINNCASEPHVQDLCNFLNKMGADIKGIGSNILKIKGVNKLHGCEHEISSDYMEVGSLIGLAAVTNSELEIQKAEPQNLRMVKIAYGKLGVHWESDKDCIFIPKNQELNVHQDIGGMIPKIDDAPWPGFPADLVSIATVIATQVKGTVLIFEKMFESRMFFVDKLVSMGASIVLCDPHRVLVVGPAKLKGCELVSPDIRAGMALLIAALCADGKSEIKNIKQIERGYEQLHERLALLGASIKKLAE